MHRGLALSRQDHVSRDERRAHDARAPSKPHRPPALRQRHRAPRCHPPGDPTAHHLEVMKPSSMNDSPRSPLALDVGTRRVTPSAPGRRPRERPRSYRGRSLGLGPPCVPSPVSFLARGSHVRLGGPAVAARSPPVAPPVLPRWSGWSHIPGRRRDMRPIGRRGALQSDLRLLLRRRGPPGGSSGGGRGPGLDESGAPDVRTSGSLAAPLGA